MKTSSWGAGGGGYTATELRLTSPVTSTTLMSCRGVKRWLKVVCFPLATILKQCCSQVITS